MTPSQFTGKPWHSRHSPLARAACVTYALLLVYSGLAPWTGWRDLGLNPFAYLAAPIPTHVTNFDLVVNVLAYLPFGALLVFALHPTKRGLTAVVIAMSVAFVVAAFIEAGQSFLQTRIPSNLDLLTNTAGATLGALAAAPFASNLIDRGRLADWRLRWFERDASLLLLLIAAWPIAQIYPEPMLFGNGNISEALSSLVTALGAILPIDNAVFVITEFADSFEVAEFVLAEAFVVAAAILAVGLAFASTMRPNAPRVKLLLALLVIALLSKTLAHAVAFGPDRALAWLTPGAYGGLALGLLSLLPASAAPRAWSARFAMLALIALVVAVSLVPENPYYVDAISAWRQGKLLNFNALAHWLSVLWPYALAFGLAIALMPNAGSRGASPASL
ncbi:MAG TPA: VanZ family protein [Burkholderiaceae bacterium]|nr:VanZ family protein [Burkholderiaceae bacterium]